MAYWYVSRNVLTVRMRRVHGAREGRRRGAKAAFSRLADVLEYGGCLRRGERAAAAVVAQPRQLCAQRRAQGEPRAQPAPRRLGRVAGEVHLRQLRAPVGLDLDFSVHAAKIAKKTARRSVFHENKWP